MKIPVLGIALIIIGIVMIVYTGFTYVTTEKVIDIDPIKVNKESNHLVEWSPIVGAVLIVGGVVVIIFDKNTRV
jgi:uncharacterized membrane protein HdeD (DUF308 family)